MSQNQSKVKNHIIFGSIHGLKGITAMSIRY